MNNMLGFLVVGLETGCLDVLVFLIAAFVRFTLLTQ
jgi:hypothetical protein